MKKKKIIKKSNERIAIHIVKRRGHKEVYDERKVYGSCYFACRNAHLHEQEAEKISEKVCAPITKWVNKSKAVSSDGIFRLVIQELRKYNDDAAFLYETHRDIS